MYATASLQNARTPVIGDVSVTNSTSTSPCQIRCSSCTLKHVCLPMGLTTEDVERLDNVVYFHRPVKRGQPLYRSGAPFNAIYAIRVGSFKAAVVHDDGREQVTGFQMAGELIGLDGISTEKHTCDAIALEDSEVCVIPFQHLEKLCRESETMQRHVHKIMSSEIVGKHGLMLMLGNMHAEERLATFLLNLSQRLKARGYSPIAFQLRMSRAEIGSYLGMKLETVSRTFSKFQDQGLINTQQKKIEITDLEGLKHIIGR
ncbi:MAG TPA: fumarate/nitrate reduction transcriptional regulator Fnr [Burkholderiales bacterium]|nr:fumarate/nitrate reduction transcriptional regulator Fnr [Burkholderiales bacterium]